MEYYYFGEIIFDGVYLEGKKWKGKVKQYYYNCELFFEGEYLKGKKHGNAKEYYDDGKLKLNYFLKENI